MARNKAVTELIATAYTGENSPGFKFSRNVGYNSVS